MRAARKLIRGAVSSVAVAVLVAALTPAAVAVAATTTETGTVDASGSSWALHEFVVVAPATVSVDLDWDDPSADLNLGLRDPSGTWVRWASSRSTRPERIVLDVTASGTWAVGVSAKKGRASYTLVIDQTTAVSPATIGDRVWSDVNANGVDDEEPGVAGARVRLYAVEGDGLVERASMLTADNGAYSFSAAPGSYRVAVELPSGFSYGVTGPGSAIDPSTGLTAPFTVVAGENLVTQDGGAVPTGATTFASAVDTGNTSWRSHELTVPTPGVLAIVLDWAESTTSNLDVFLRSPAGKWVASAVSTTARPEVLSHAVAEPGTWTIGVRATSGAARYVADARLATSGPTSAPMYLRTIGGPARAEAYPSGVDVDGAGTVYVADTGNDGVKAYGPDGVLRWAVGSRGRLAGQFSEPRDVAVVGGRVYVADTGNNRVQVLDAATGSSIVTWGTWFGALMGVSAGVDAAGDPVILTTDGKDTVSRVRVHGLDGVVLRTIGSGFGTGDGQLNEPRDAATGADGRVYVADFRNHRIARFGPGGAWLGSFGSLGNGPGEFNGPYGIDVGPDGHVYVADANNARIQELTTAGGFLSSFGTRGPGVGELTQLRNVAVGAGTAPAVYAADLWGFKIVEYRQDGSTRREFAGSAPAAGGFNKPYGLTLTASDAFVADTTNQRIERFDHTGAFELQFGDRRFGEDVSGFNWPRDVAADGATGSVWVADTKNDRIIQFSESGVPSGQKFGSRGSGLGQFVWPHAIAAVDGDLIVADTWNHRVQRIRPPNQIVWTATGFNYPKDVTVTGGLVYVADSLNGRVATLRLSDGTQTSVFGGSDLHRPEGIAVAPDGTVWVSDTSWNRLVRFSPSGVLVDHVGSKGSAHGRFDEPTKLEIRSTATTVELYVVDSGNDRVEVFRIG